VHRRRFDQRRQGHERVGVGHIDCGIDRQPGQDGTAARGLLYQKIDILAQRVVGHDVALHFLGNDGDGRERRAKLVRRRRGERPSADKRCSCASATWAAPSASLIWRCSSASRQP